MLRIFGILDLLFALSFVLLRVGVSKTIFFFFAVLVVAKAFIFITSPVSWVDIIAVMVIAFVPGMIGWILLLWFVQKGIFSMA